VLSRVLAWALVWKLRDMQGQPNDFPRTRLSAAQLDQLAVARANGILDINADWRFSTDPQQQGEAQGWMQPGFDDKTWQAAATGASWESLLGADYDGMGWYRRKVQIPAEWAGGRIRLVCAGVDDAYTVWVNGRRMQSHGSFTDHEATVWEKQTTSDITAALQPGEENTIALQVVDIVGQGGVWKPLYLSVE
jgi:beta-galactosidase/beta-glucuronidase